MKERQGLVLVRPLILRGGSKLSRASGMSRRNPFFDVSIPTTATRGWHHSSCQMC
jgi:hypothetical protein